MKLSDAQMRALRALAEGRIGIGRHDGDALQRKGFAYWLANDAYVITSAGRAWLAEHDEGES